MNEEQKKKCEELWVEHEQYVKNVCKAKLHGYEIEYEDAVADVYLAFCNQIVKKGFPENTKAWLFCILRNIIKEKYRKKQKYQETFVDVDTDSIEIPSQHDFVDDIIINERLEKVNKIIPTLKRSEQIILKHTYFSKRSMKDIAKQLDSTENAVKQKRYRICNNMRKMLDQK